MRRYWPFRVEQTEPEREEDFLDLAQSSERAEAVHAETAGELVEGSDSRFGALA